MFSDLRSGNFVEEQSVRDRIVDMKGNPDKILPLVKPTPTATPMQASPGSAALAQALRTDAGAPIFGTSGDEKGKKPGAWNVESLRYMGSEA